MERKARILDGKRVFRLGRHALFASTALSAAVLAAPAHAQTTVAPDATPTGGVVVGGSASIAQAPGSTTIDQSSQRAAINWQSFNVGANAQVQFNQPSSTAIALNRVVGGDLSQINGKINANGQLVLINQSGVVFGQGAQVNAESVVVSTSNISDKDFMAGHLNFTGAPNPGAKIINEGHITAREAGLVGLVAPQVINSGVITAKLGQVVLAGATAFTLDLYGDRLISLDVTQAVRSVDVGGKKVVALVTNSGVIVADGGRITLTAQDADALVTQLINAGGTIRADTVGSHTGSIAVQGIGGDIMIAGNLLARGTAAGGHGGAVQAMASGTVAVAGSADIDVSGQAGGGVVALGTSLARAQGGASYGAAPEAAAVVVAPGAQIHANATGTGDGGTVALLSTTLTDFEGGIDVRGGSQSGNGGAAEISSDGVISLGGTVLATAANGSPGQILLDPDILNVVAVATSGIDTGMTAGGTITFGNTMTGTASNVLTAQLLTLSGEVVLEAHSLISVASAVDMPLATALSLVSLGDISITAGISIAGDLDINAANSLVVDGALQGSDVALASGTAGTSIDAPVSGGLVLVVGKGTISEGSFVSGEGVLATTLVGAINTPQLTTDNTTIGGSLLLTNSNSIGSLASLAVAGSLGLQLNDSAPLSIIGTVQAPTATIAASSIAVTGSLAIAHALTLESANGISEAGGVFAASLNSGGTAIGGDVSLTGTNTIATLAGFSLSGNHTLDLLDKATLGVTGPVVAAVATLSAPSIAVSGQISAATALALESTGNVNEIGGGSITTGTLSTGGTFIGGDVSLVSGFNHIGTLGGFAVASGHTLVLDDVGLLTVAQASAGSVTLAASNFTIPGTLAAGLLALETAGSITATGSVLAGTLTSGGTTIGSGNSIGSGALFTGSNTIATLGGFTVAAGSGFVLDDTGSLNVAGAVNAPTATISAGSIGISGSLSVASQLVLESLGTVSEAGSIDAGTLSSGGTTIGGNVVLNGTNVIGTLAGFTVGTGDMLDLTNTGLLTVAGPVTGPVVSLSAPTIDITGNIDATTSLALGGSGTIQQTGTAGSIIAGALVSIGSIGGDVLLNAAGNSIASLGGFTLGGTLDLTTATALNIYGVVKTPGLVDLSGTSLTESGAGALDVATLTSTPFFTGSVALGGANDIGTLMGFGADGNLAVVNTSSIDVLNFLDGASVTLVAPTIGINGVIVAGSTTTPGTLALAANVINAGTYTENGDTFNSALYVSYGTIEIAPYTSGKAIDIGSLAANDLDILPSLTSIIDTFRAPDEIVIGEAAGRSAGAITIDNATSLGIGLVDLAMPAPADGASSVIQDNGTLNVANILAFSGGGFLQGPNGEIEASTLQGDGGTIAGPVSLTSSLNEIDTLGSITLPNTADFALTDASELFAKGPVTARDITLAAYNMETDGPLTAAEGGTIDLIGDTITDGGGTLSAPGGTVAFAPFTDNRDVDFGGGGSYYDLELDAGFATLVNAAVLQIGTASNHFGGTLNVEGPLTISAPTLSLSGTAVTFSSTLDEPGLVTFNSPGDVTENSGAVIIAGTVGGNGGTVSLLGGNSIGTLGNLTAQSNFAIRNTPSLIIAGTVSALGTAAGTGIVTLEDAGAVTETTGAITARSLDTGGTALGGDLILGQANSIAALGGVTLGTHTLVLNENQTLTVNGPVSAGNATITTPGMTIAGALDVTNTLALGGTGGVDETTGLVTAGSLISVGTIGGDVALGNVNNIATLGGFTVAAGHGFDLHDAGLLTVAGPLVAPNTTLSSGSNTMAGSIAIAGDIDAATLLALESTGGITQSAGLITTGQLTTGGTAVGGDLRLFDANSIASVGGVTVAAGHSFAVNDAGLLTVAGPVSAPVVTLSGAGIAISGTVTAPGSLALRSTAGVTEPGGVIQTAELTSDGTTIGGAATLLGANSITSLGSFTAPDLALNNTGDLTINGLVTAPGALTLADTGNINETTGGTIVAGTLDSGGTTIGGNVGLQNANSIGTLGNLALNGNFLLNDAPSLSIAGLLATPNDVAIDAHDIVETSGGISANYFTGNAGGSILLGNANSISTLGPVQAGGNILLDNVVNLAIAGTIGTPGTLTLQGAGNMTETTGVISASTLDSNGAIDGDVLLVNANSIATVGGFAVAEGHALVVTDAGPLALAGPIAATNAVFAASAIGIAGGVDVDGSLAFESSGNVTESGGVITAGVLSSGGTNIGGDVVLNNGNDIASLSGLSANGGLTLNDQAPLQITGNVSLGGALALSGNGDIDQTGGSIVAAELLSDGGVNGAVSLQQPGNVIPVLGAFAAADGLSLNDSGPLALTGDIFTGADALNLGASGAITQQGGIITAGLVNAGAPEITLGDANAIGDLGAVNTDHLLANGVAAITGPVNANNATVASPGDLALSGPVSASNALILTAAGALTQNADSGPVNASTATFSAAAMNLAGTTDIGGLLDLESPNGNIIHDAGLLQAGTLTGHAGSLASFTGLTDFATLGSFFMQDSLFVLHNSGPLVFVGPLLASAVSITVQGQLTLDGTDNGGLFITGGIEPSTATVPTLNDSVLDVVPAPQGGSPQIVQTGTFFINAGPNAANYLGSKTPQATLFMSATPDGGITFAPAPPTTGGLDGPDVDAILDVGTGGTISGNINLYRVVILAANTVDLSGSLDNVSGSQGAGKGFVNPFPVPSFRFNACPIGSVNCTILPIESLPSADPLQNFYIEERKKRRLNHNVQLPGIATRDF